MWAQARGGSIPLARTIGDNGYLTRNEFFCGHRFISYQLTFQLFSLPTGCLADFWLVQCCAPADGLLVLDD